MKKIFVSIFFVIFIASLASCSYVSTVRNYTVDSFSISTDDLDAAKSASCVLFNDDYHYSGVIFENDDTTYYVASVYNDTQFDSVELNDSTTESLTCVGQDEKNNVSVYTFTSSNSYTVANEASTDITKGDSIISISTTGDFSTDSYTAEIDTLNSIKDGVISNVNSAYFMTSCSINYPDLGCAIFDDNGDMLGFVYSLIYSTDGDDLDSSYSNYATSMNMSYTYDHFIDICNLIINNGDITHGLLGINIYNSESVSNITLPDDKSSLVVIYSVVEDYPASNAGIEAGDLIYSINDVEITRVYELKYQLSLCLAGDTVSISVYDSSLNIQNYTLTLE